VAKTNYHQIRRQKELAKKTRQQEKQQKRLAAKTSTPDAEAASAAEDPGSLGPSTGSEGV
jgi:ATP-dependent exoDNAse (exonuclease V) alpha subunit